MNHEIFEGGGVWAILPLHDFFFDAAHTLASHTDAFLCHASRIPPKQASVETRHHFRSKRLANHIVASRKSRSVPARHKFKMADFEESFAYVSRIFRINSLNDHQKRAIRSVVVGDRNDLFVNLSTRLGKSLI